MTSYKIYTYPNNPRVHKSLIAAKYAGVQIETPAFNFPQDLSSKEFLAKNPLGKVPVLETPQGSIFESNAILRYVARKDKREHGLYGANDYESGLVDQWIDFSVNEVELPLNVWIYPVLGWMQFDHDATEKAKQDVQKALNVLNQHLLSHTYLVGESITIADIALALTLLRGYTTLFDTKFRKPYQNVNRWFTTCVSQPEWHAYIGTVELAKEMKVAKPAEKKAEAPKKEEKKPAPKKEAASEADEEEEEHEPPRKANPLDALPPSKLNLDEWKRFYSNAEDTKTIAMPWFWERLDDGYSLWHGEYKYAADLLKLLNTNNLAGGMIQRLDRVRKYGFASIIIFGDEPPVGLEIGCVFLLRGQVIPPELTEVDDYELFEWKKLDPTSVVDKALVADYWAWSGDFGGRAKQLNAAKMFK
jgi:elongation factor 1-gamma